MKKLILLITLVFHSLCAASEITLVDGVTVTADDAVWRTAKLEGIAGNTLIGPMTGKTPLRFVYEKEQFSGTAKQYIAASKQSLADEYGKIEVTRSGKVETKLHGAIDFVLFVYSTSKGDRFHALYALKRGRQIHTFQAFGDAPFYEKASGHISEVVQSISIK
jgi:hypothetical protein